MAKVQQTILAITDATIDSSGYVYSPILDARRWDFDQKGAFGYEFSSANTSAYAICSVGLLVSVSNGGEFYAVKNTGYAANGFIGHAACTGAFALTAGGVVNFNMPCMAPYVKAFVKSTTDTRVILNKLYLVVNEEL